MDRETVHGLFYFYTWKYSKSFKEFQRKLFRSSLGIVGINLRLIEVLYFKSLILIFLRNGKSINKTVCSGLLQDFK